MIALSIDQGLLLVFCVGIGWAAGVGVGLWLLVRKFRNK